MKLTPMKRPVEWFRLEMHWQRWVHDTPWSGGWALGALSIQLMLWRLVVRR